MFNVTVVVDRAKQLMLLSQPCQVRDRVDKRLNIQVKTLTETPPFWNEETGNYADVKSQLLHKET